MGVRVFCVRYHWDNEILSRGLFYKGHLRALFRYISPVVERHVSQMIVACKFQINLCVLQSSCMLLPHQGNILTHEGENRSKCTCSTFSIRGLSNRFMMFLVSILSSNTMIARFKVVHSQIMLHWAVTMSSMCCILKWTNSFKFYNDNCI